MPEIKIVSLRGVRVFIAGLAFLLGACALPEQGPSTRDVTQLDGDEEYELVPLTPAIAEKLSSSPEPGFSAAFLSAPRTTTGTRLGIGDKISITIFESELGGLFNNANGITTIPDIEVDPDGFITVPYTGEILARGQSPENVEEQIVAALDGKAIEPQAQVTQTLQANRSVTVMGEVMRPALVPLNLRGGRLSDALAMTGGPKFATHESYVSLTRRGKTSTASLHRILNDPNQNIALRPDDLISVLHKPRSYTVIGSVTQPDNVALSAPDVTLMQAIGKSSGLLDARADPSGVFLLRRETAKRLNGFKLDAKAWWPKQKRGIATVYWIDFSEPEALFMAQSVHMKDGDIIYVANAGAVSLGKALGLFGLSVNAASQASALAK